MNLNSIKKLLTAAETALVNKDEDIKVTQAVMDVVYALKTADTKKIEPVALAKVALQLSAAILENAPKFGDVERKLLAQVNLNIVKPLFFDEELMSPAGTRAVRTPKSTSADTMDIEPTLSPKNNKRERDTQEQEQADFLLAKKLQSESVRTRRAPKKLELNFDADRTQCVTNQPTNRSNPKR